MLFKLQHVSLLVLLSVAFAMPSFADSTVRQDGTGDFTTIGAAVAAAAAGDTITVTDQGEYNETFDLNDVSLVSDPYGSKIFGDPSVLDGGNELITIGHTQEILFEGFTVESQRHGIQVWGAATVDLTIRACIIKAPWAGVNFFNNNTTDATCGTVTIDGTYMSNSDYNIQTSGGGTAQGTLNIINDSHIFGSWNGCIKIMEPMSLNFDGVEIGNSGAGNAILFHAALGTGAVDLNASNTKIHSNAMTGVMIEAGSGNFTFANCEITDNGEWGLNSWTGSDDYDRTITVTDTLISANTFEAIAINGANTDTSKVQFDIERCVLRDGSEGAASTVMLNKANGSFVNNLVDHGSHLVQLNDGIQNFYFNTFVSTADLDWLRAIMITGGATVDAKNNIFAGVGVGIANDSGTATLTCDNNLFDTRVVTPIVGGTAGVASFVNVNPFFEEASSGVGTGSFALTVESKALAAGVDVAGITVDINNGERANPSGSFPDLGAYESLMTPVELSEFMID